MESIVIYQSKTGFTKRYAEWIAEELGCKAVPAKEVTTESLASCHTIIYGGGIMAGQIGGFKKFKQVLTAYPDKKLIAFASGSSSVEVIEKDDQIRKANFTDEERNKIPFFYFEGGLNYEKMGLGAKLLIKMIVSSAVKKKNQSKKEYDRAVTMKRSCDFSDRKAIAPLLQCIREKA